jgi:starch-binding outer membrane protein, SusD/RagB family
MTSYNHGLRAVAIGLAALGLAACETDSLVNLQNPDLITGPVVRDSANADQLYNGALFEFGRALTGAAATNDNPGIVGVSGLMADELWYSSTFSTMQDIDARDLSDVTNGVLATTFQRIHRARNLADRTYEQFVAINKGSTARAAQMASYSGFSFLSLAENFCSGVPASRTSLNGEVVFGTPLTTAQMLDSAEARFNLAITIATSANDAQELNLARVGLGRTLLDQGDFAGAAAAVSAVPSNFVYNVGYSSSATGQNNGIWQNINSERRSSAASGEGINGLVFFNRGPAGTNTTDPRVSVDSGGFGIGAPTPLYIQHKYNTRGAPVPLATGTEARLIEAEAALAQGSSASYLTTLNTLRSDAGITPPLVDPGTAAGRVNQFFAERARWLWLTGHRLSDLRRLVRQYNRPTESVFPTGQTIFGAPYGTDVNLPIPFQERNNPNATSGACIDRNA